MGMRCPAFAGVTAEHASMSNPAVWRPLGRAAVRGRAAYAANATKGTIDMSNDDIVDRLNKLIDTCKDGEYGFRSCADHVKSTDLKEIFLRRAEDCQRGASQLQALVVKYGGEPDAGSSLAGTLHRGWVSVVGTLSGHSDKAMLEECERGEDAALTRYRDALKEALPADVMSVVQAQYEGVKRNHAQIRDLRNQVRAAS
jgi:uncharacterized protein (TIGR02284 family)